MIKESEFKAWLENPVTVSVFNLLKAYRQFYISQILEGAPRFQSSENALYEHIGRVNAYDDLLQIHYSSVKEEDNE